MTMIEVVIAAMILVVGSLAVLTLVDTAARSTFRGEQSQVVNDRLQEELEQIRQLPYEEVALTAAPADTADTSIPAWRVSGSSYATNRDGSNQRPLVLNGGTFFNGDQIEDGTVSPAPVPFTNGDVSGTLYRYIVWEDDPTCPSTRCPGEQDMKRVIVAALLDDTATGGERIYQELQARLTDPEAKPVDNDNPIPPGGGPGVPWTFFLTDTTCNNPTRQPIISDHDTHNTRGRCSAGQTSGNNPGAPDLMYPSAPLLDPEAPIWDYATDVEPAQDPESDRGLQLVKGATNGCVSYALDLPLVPEIAEPDRFQKVHKWLSPPVPGGFDVQLNGEGALNLWTQTINEAVHPGKICMWLFVRQTNVLGIPVDTPAVNLAPPLVNLTYFTYEEDQWPTTWTEIHIPLRFLLDAHLLPGSRLGVAFTVERAGTGGGGLQFMYDEPSFDSRLEVKSTSLLPDF